MYEKEVSADFVGHKIVVKNRWAFFLDTIEPGEISLSIDGKVVDSSRRRFWFRTSVPILRGELQIDSRTHKVEVFVRALFSVRIKICVDNQKLAGDLLATATEMLGQPSSAKASEGILLRATAVAGLVLGPLYSDRRDNALDTYTSQ